MKGLRKNRRHGGGFTLIEVMLAVAILGIGLLTLVTGAARCLSVIKRAQYFEEARHLIGMLELVEPIDMEDIQEGTESGRFSGYYSGFRWERAIQLVSEDEEYPLFSVTTRIRWTVENVQKAEEVTTLLHAPEADL